jgi:hypothetical protein
VTNLDLSSGLPCRICISRHCHAGARIPQLDKGGAIARNPGLYSRSRQLARLYPVGRRSFRDIRPQVLVFACRGPLFSTGPAISSCRRLMCKSLDLTYRTMSNFAIRLTADMNGSPNSPPRNEFQTRDFIGRCPSNQIRTFTLLSHPIVGAALCVVS